MAKILIVDDNEQNCELLHDVDDLFLNTVGCAVGYILFVICNGIRRKHDGQ